MPRRKDEATAREILRYFLRNPQAADDLEGVARWRLLNERIHRSVEETNNVLEELVKEGFLLKLSSVSLEPVFCLNRARQAEVQAYITGVRRAGSGNRSEEGTNGAPQAPGK